MDRHLVLILIMISGVMAADQIGPNKGANVISKEGESVTLTCTYDTSSRYVRLYWYRLYRDGEPQYLMWKDARAWSSTGTPADRRFQSTTSETTTEFTIDSVTLSDSALYYCALFLGGTGESGLPDPLTFGNPIRLTVIPKDVPETAPVLSVLSPFKGNGPDICLAAGFFPQEKSMTLTVEGNKTVSLTSSNAPLFSTTKTYYYAGFSDNKKINECKMDGQTADKTSDTPETTDKPERPTQNKCETNARTSASGFIDTGVPKMNFMNLLVTGLRILLAKCVAVNVMMTVKAFVF